MADLTNQENIFEGVKESITAINVEINGFKNVDKSNQINYAGHTINYGKSPNIVTSSDNQLSHANIVKNDQLFRKLSIRKSKIRSGKEMNVIISGLE